MSDELELYKALKKKGLSLIAISVVLGHGSEESGNECNRLQGDFAGDRAKSREYTEAIDSGRIARNDFVFHGPNGGGYGWLQWTFWARKAGLWNVAKENGWSIGSVEAAVEWFWEELHQSEYSVVFTALNSDISLREMSDVFMHRFERPADQSDSACARRYALCQKMYEKYRGVVEEEKPKNQENVYWPPRELCKGMNGPDVEALQGLLYSHGYTYGSTKGVFGDSTEKAVRKYQSENVDLEGKPLKVDGIAGRKTWGSLVKM